MDEQLYKELIIEHYQDPQNKGRMENSDFTAVENNPACGDEIEIFLKMENGKVSEMKHDSKGCAISQASVSMLSEKMIGMNKEQLTALTKEDILGMLGITVSSMRLRCALLSLETVRKAII